MYLLLGPRPVQRRFGDDFSSWDLFGFEVGDFVTLGKTTPAECFASGILFDDYLSVGLGDLFLDDGLVDAGIFISWLILIHFKKYIMNYLNYSNNSN